MEIEFYLASDVQRCTPRAKYLGSEFGLASGVQSCTPFAKYLGSEFGLASGVQRRTPFAKYLGANHGTKYKFLGFILNEGLKNEVQVPGIHSERGLEEQQG